VGAVVVVSGRYKEMAMRGAWWIGCGGMVIVVLAGRGNWPELHVAVRRRGVATDPS